VLDFLRKYIIEGGIDMLFMVVFTYEPKDREAVVNRRIERGQTKVPGMKTIGEWSYVGGSKVFQLVECNDPRSMSGASSAWADLGTIEIFPVMETEELMKLMPK
jgi:hypothetical protein